MKFIFVLFIIISFNACKSQSQTETNILPEFGTILIDPSIKKRFFEEPPMRVEVNVGKVKINSYIRDTVRSRPLFDTCSCLFTSDDTLVIEFKSLLGINSDTIKIKVTNDTYGAIYIKTQRYYPAVSGSLKLRDKPHSKGQEIFGELGLEFFQNDQDSSRFFKGPFRCTIE